MVIDDGQLTNMDDLPMTAISLSGTAFKDLMYQYHTIGPLTCYQGGDTERDEIQCGSGIFVDKSRRCIYDVDAYGNSKGCRATDHLENCDDFVCENNFFKCPGSFCISLRMVCNGVTDCLNGEDEVECELFSCPGLYKCQEHNFCIEPSQICDGSRHCPLADDETMCNLECPVGCNCLGHTYLCKNVGFDRMPKDLPVLLRKLDLSGNNLQVTLANLTNFDFLGELIISENQITELAPRTFYNLKNLYFLDLSFNLISVLVEGTFDGLINLQDLNLLGNKNLVKIEARAFTGLVNIPELVLKQLAIQELEVDAFTGLPLLTNLDLSSNRIEYLEAGVFEGLEDLFSLNLSNNADLQIKKDAFADLESLAYLQSDDFKYCCFVNDRVPEENCLPERDELSSCEDLMRRDVLKAFLWILGLMAFICNIFVVVWRAREKKFSVYSFSVFNLAISDLLMGIYMVTLAVVDIYYRGVYIEYAEAWTKSWLCQVLGVLNTLSSEASVFILCLISWDRFYNIVFPFRAMQGSKSLKSTVLVMLLIWLAATILAILPLFPLEYFKGGYYGRSGMCISIHLTNEASPGWEFSVAIFHGMNFSCFMFIFLSYAYMYRVVTQSSKSSSGKDRASEADIKLARRITLVVATDFLCWVPINIMGAAALGGVRIPGEVYAWVVVFLLPVNSAINPLLYTISAINVMKKSAKEKSVKTLSTTSADSNLFYINEPKASKSLKEYLGSYQQLPVDTAQRLLLVITKVMVEVHQSQKMVGNLEPGSVYIFTVGSEMSAALQILPQISLGEPNHSEDIAALGKLFSNILRRCAKSK